MTETTDMSDWTEEEADSRRSVSIVNAMPRCVGRYAYGYVVSKADDMAKTDGYY